MGSGGAFTLNRNNKNMLSAARTMGFTTIRTEVRAKSVV